MSTSKLGRLSLIGDQECWGPAWTTVLVYHSTFVCGLTHLLDSKWNFYEMNKLYGCEEILTRRETEVM